MGNLHGDEARVKKLVHSQFPDGIQPFQPVIYYDSGLDRVVVVTRDCSHSEIPVNDFLVLFEDNHPESRRMSDLPCVGFGFNSAKRFAKHYSVPNHASGVINVHSLLDFLALQTPFDDKVVRDKALIAREQLYRFFGVNTLVRFS